MGRILGYAIKFKEKVSTQVLDRTGIRAPLKFLFQKLIDYNALSYNCWDSASKFGCSQFK